MAMVKDNLIGLRLAKVPMAKPLAAFIIGICVAYYSNPDFFCFGVFLLPCLVALQLSSFRNRKTRWGRILFTIVFYCVWGMLGGWLAVRTMPSSQPLHFSNFESQGLLVIVDDEPQRKGKTIRFPAKVKVALYDDAEAKVEGSIVVSVLIDSLYSELIQYGDVLYIPSYVKEIEPPSNPQQFDYKNYLRAKDIWHQCFVPIDRVAKVGTDKGNPFFARALFFRKQMMEKFALYIKDYDALQLAVALIFGYRSEMDEHTVHVFTNTGTVHILSVSGLHVAMVFGLLTFILRWMGYFRHGKYFRNLFIVVAVWFYVVLTGMSPPILRAGVMITFFIVSLTINRHHVTLNTLFGSALFILLITPKSLFDIGFQLSYLAVLGILLVHPLLKLLYLPKNRWLALVVEYTYISIAAQLFTLPVILYYFAQFPTYFIPANLFIALPSTGIMYLGIVLALCPFGVINAYLGLLLQALLRFSVKGLEYLEKLPYAVIKGWVWDETQVIFAFLTLLFLVYAWKYKGKKALFALLLCCVCSFVYAGVQYLARSQYRGYRIYNVRSDLAVARINKGKVLLYSTFDSLAHRGNRFATLPDLRRFATENRIAHVRLSDTVKQNYIISFGKKRMLILETVLIDTLQDIDVVVWRKNNRNLIEDVKVKVKGNPILLVDGSNSDATVSAFRKNESVAGEQMYILKNNFAYVWDEE